MAIGFEGSLRFPDTSGSPINKNDLLFFSAVAVIDSADSGYIQEAAYLLNSVNKLSRSSSGKGSPSLANVTEFASRSTRTTLQY
jgi:hypothetical protein